MIQSNYNSFIYTHIPKCGGTSFREYIYRAGLANGIDPEKMHVPGFGDLPNDKNIEQLSDEELEEFRKQEKLILACHARYNVHAKYRLGMYNPFYYIIYREPVKRFVSHYNFFYRDLGYGDLKGVALNDVPDEQLEDLLLKMSNIQIVYTVNVSKPIGRKADESWLDEAKKNLSKWYGAFGVLEEMELSVQWLKQRSPEWLSFPDMDFPVKNRGNGSKKKQLDDQLVDKIRKYNSFDLKLYEHAVELLHASCNQEILT